MRLCARLLRCGLLEQSVDARLDDVKLPRKTLVVTVQIGRGEILPQGLHDVVRHLRPSADRGEPQRKDARAQRRETLPRDVVSILSFPRTSLGRRGQRENGACGSSWYQ